MKNLTIYPFSVVLTLLFIVHSHAQAPIQSTIQGQLLMLDCTMPHYSPDHTIQFTHRHACLARVKRRNDHLIFPSPDGTYHDITFKVFVDATPRELTNLTFHDRTILFNALQTAALTNAVVYISITGAFRPADKSFNVSIVRILTPQTSRKFAPSLR